MLLREVPVSIHLGERRTFELFSLRMERFFDEAESTFEFREKTAKRFFRPGLRHEGDVTHGKKEIADFLFDRFFLARADRGGELPDFLFEFSERPFDVWPLKTHFRDLIDRFFRAREGR